MNSIISTIYTKSSEIHVKLKSKSIVYTKAMLMLNIKMEFESYNLHFQISIMDSDI